MRYRTANLLASSLLAVLAILARPLPAAVTLVQEADVSARSFSVVALSDRQVLGVTLEVFDDAAGTVPSTGAGIVVDSAGIPAAHDNGIVKVSASGLAPESTYYFRLTVSASDGDSVFPADTSLYGVNTASRPAALVSAGNFAINELVRFQPYVPSTLAEPRAMLLLLELPAVSPTAISAFVDASAPVVSTYIDTNNLIDQNGARLLTAAGTTARLREVRGLACSEPTRVRFRRTPALTPVGDPLAFQSLAPCFFADTVCDDRIDVLDFQFLLNSFGAATGDCGYSPDLDIVSDDAIDVLDMQSVLNRFGESAPFN